MQTTGSRRLGLTVLAALGLGCGGENPLTLSQFCVEKAARECSGVATNCSAPAAACADDRVAACLQFVSLQEPVATRPFRPDKAEDCLNVTAAIHKKSPITPADRQMMNDLCERVFSGAKKKGQDCVSTFECDGDLICDQTVLVCATKKVVAPDEFCNNPGDVCPPGQRCLPVATTRQCLAPNIPAGQACDDDTNPCASSLRCVQGVCMDKVMLNGACTRDSDCVATAPYCDPYFANTCDSGFIPSRGTPECEDFGAPPTP